MKELSKKVGIFFLVMICVIFLANILFRFVLPIKPVVMVSESMYPTFNKWDVLFYTKANSYAINDVVIFYSLIKDPIVARIIEINPDGTYKLKGDNPKTNPVPIKNQFLDETQVPKEKVKGKILYSINPFIFYFFNWGIQIVLSFVVTKMIYSKLSKKRAS